MIRKVILIKLRELHEELSAINHDIELPNQVEDETIAALGQLVSDINTLVDHAKESPPRDSNQHHDVLEQIAQFETKHPQVTRFLSQVTDVLAMMGI